MSSELSIVVTLRDSQDDFETTLVSVLENRPANSEIIVAHDGSYEDPFNLADELEFVVAEDDSLLQLVKAGVTACRSDIVHIVADGFVATERWTDPIADCFQDPDVGCVSPVIHDLESGRILASGWAADAIYVRRQIAHGATAVGRLETGRIGGPYLVASFWRREILLSLLAIDALITEVEAELIWADMLADMGKEIRIEQRSRIGAEASRKEICVAGFRNGYQTQVALSARRSVGVFALLGETLLGCVAAPHRLERWTTALGRLAGSIFSASRSRRLAQSIESINGVNLRDSSPPATTRSVSPQRSIQRQAA